WGAALFVASAFLLVSGCDARAPADKEEEERVSRSASIVGPEGYKGPHGSRAALTRGGKRFLWKTGGWGACFLPSSGEDPQSGDVGGEDDSSDGGDSIRRGGGTEDDSGGRAGSSRCGEGRRERSVWCSEVDGRTVLEFLCESPIRPTRTKPCFLACEHHRDHLQWEAGPWGPCRPMNNDDEEDDNKNSVQDVAGEDGSLTVEGVQVRTVECVLWRRRRVDDENCFGVARRPSVERQCRTAAPASVVALRNKRDCQVSDWGGWSGCIAPCKSPPGSTAAPDVVNVETRVRRIILSPRNGGNPCPPLVETRPCPSIGLDCPQNTSPSASTEAPTTVEDAAMADEAMAVADEAEAGEYRLRVGQWRRCEAAASLVSADESLSPRSSLEERDDGDEVSLTVEPQVGFQTREVTCRDSRGAIVQVGLCLGRKQFRSSQNSIHKLSKDGGPLPPDVRPCVVPQDCVVSQWSPWERVREGCYVGPTEKAKPEIHLRKRELVQMQHGEGLPCPHLVEVRRITERESLQLCSEKYRWLPSKWSSCVVNTEGGGIGLAEVGCGGGIQLRNLTCVSRDGDKPVGEDLCSSLEPLPTVQRCEVACPRDCEMGEWGSWGPCRPLHCPRERDPNHRPLPPPSQGYRERIRPVLVASSPAGVDCPAEREVQSCVGGIGSGTHTTSVGFLSCHAWLPHPTRRHWGPCDLDPGVTRCGEGKRTREVRCRALFKVEGPGGGGGEMVGADGKLEVEGETREPASVSEQRGTENWEEDPSDPTTSTLMGPVVPDSACEEEEEVTWSGGEGSLRLSRPPTEERCLQPCPLDCVLSPWSPWSPCSLPCASAHHTPLRHRNRTVIAPAGPGGHPCPDPDEMLQMEPCNVHSCTGYSWMSLPWQECLPPQESSCGDGVRKREVWCVEDNERRVPEWRCEPLPKPGIIRPCKRPCPVDCLVSSWSDWSPCPRQCMTDDSHEEHTTGIGIEAVPTQRRWRVVLRQPSAPPVIKEEEDDEDDEDDDMPLFQGSDAGGDISHWEEDTNRFDRTQEESSFEDSRNGKYLHQTIPLFRDASKFRLKIMSLVRSDYPTPKPKTANPHRGGRPCPSLEEVRPCPYTASICANHTWRVGDWSHCRLTTNVQCGQGFRTRAVTCIQNGAKEVEPSLCFRSPTALALSETKFGLTMLSTGESAVNILPSSIETASQPPKLSEPCDVSCDLQCVLTQWSSWSPCKRPCAGHRDRTRALIGHSALREECHDIKLFPLAEKKQCPCDLFAWVPDGPWSSCILNEKNDRKEESLGPRANGRSPAAGLCGAGRRYRRRECRDKDGNLVEPSWCLEGSGMEEEPCLVPCPADCHLGPWSSWGSCSTLCGPGMQNRTREIIRPEMNGGRPCGPTLEWKVCDKPCSQFHWVVGGWNDCQLIPSDRVRGCGTGDQFREVRCLRIIPHRPPLEVGDEMCDPIIQPADVNACHVACPGQCVVSPWSDWSDCPKPCDPHKERQRTRSILRAPVDSASISLSHLGSHMSAVHTCPPLIQVETCVEGVSCFSHGWVATPWGSCLPLGGSPCGEGVQSRAVVCRRGGKENGRAVDDKFCELEGVRPSPSEKWCYVDCPVDCEVTAWGLWDTSECQCGSPGGKMTRQRYIQTNPSEMGRPCPTELVQKRPCPAVPCYYWERGEWSQCNLHGASCGHGTISRNITCRREGTSKSYNSISVSLEPDANSRSIVEDSYCLPQSLPTTAATLSTLPRTLAVSLDLIKEDSCYVPCHRRSHGKGGIGGIGESSNDGTEVEDCEVSEWGRWSHCHRSCREGGDSGSTGGYQTRSRTVLRPVKPGANGGPPPSCPTALWETRPCASTSSAPCLTYRWAILPSSEGPNAPATIVCLRSDGVEVEGACEGQPKPCPEDCDRIPGAVCSGSSGNCVCRDGLRARFTSPPKGGSAGSGRGGGSAYRRGRLSACEMASADGRSGRGGVVVRGGADGGVLVGVQGVRGTEDDAEIQSRFYYPKDDDVNIWMFAMIGIGCVFIVFVAVSIYLMCHGSSNRGGGIQQRIQGIGGVTPGSSSGTGREGKP
ncbi:thrombospondin type-1 domain-containing protein 7B-like, partial [Hetaerina americana]|uniref:thrombospondin type-1 domain-containing protein 7B-like n=1 Tax=Hetaerina americana TaxID=62018 RepID=UPI003A7F5F73